VGDSPGLSRAGGGRALTIAGFRTLGAVAELGLALGGGIALAVMSRRPLGHVG